MIQQLIENAAIVGELEATNKDGALKELLGKAGAAGAFPAKAQKALAKRLSEREAIGSTGLGNTVAVPHVKGDNVDPARPWSLARCRRGLEWQAIDGRAGARSCSSWSRRPNEPEEPPAVPALDRRPRARRRLPPLPARCAERRTPCATCCARCPAKRPHERAGTELRAPAGRAGRTGRACTRAPRTCSCRRPTPTPASLRVGRTDNDERVDGKSIMGMMMLAAERGVELELESTGPDAEQQLRALAELVAARFGED